MSKVQKTSIFDKKLLIKKNLRVFSENPAVSLFYVYGPLTSCKKSEKSVEHFLRKVRKTSIFDTKLLIKKNLRVFSENRAVSPILLFGPLTSCKKKSENSLEPFPRKTGC